MMRNADKNALEFRKQAIEEGWLTEEEADDIENTAEQAVEDAVKLRTKVNYQMKIHYTKMFCITNL